MVLDSRLLRADDRHHRPDCARLLELPLAAAYRAIKQQRYVAYPARRGAMWRSVFP